MKNLYHGSIEVFEDINPKKGKGYKDFGKGFYATIMYPISRHITSHMEKMREYVDMPDFLKKNDTGRKLCYTILKRGRNDER